MRDPWDWGEEDIQALLREQRQEDLRLEYKKSDALGRTDSKKRELTKDVSAMANSAGGTILYGIDEQKSTGFPVFDGGVDPQEVSGEWLEQVIDSGIQRRIDGVAVRSVSMTGTGKVVYLVYIPQSNRAPHMAADHRYYKRLGTTTAMMEEYEVRDVSHRSEAPDLNLGVQAVATGTQGQIQFTCQIENHSPEPVLYATCRLYIDLALKIELYPGSRWDMLEDKDMLWHNKDRICFHVIRHSWSVPECHPVLEGEKYQMHDIRVNVGYDYRQQPEIQRYNIGWELRSPKSLSKLEGLKLKVDTTGLQIENFVYALAPIP